MSRNMGDPSPTVRPEEKDKYGSWMLVHGLVRPFVPEQKGSQTKAKEGVKGKQKRVCKGRCDNEERESRDGAPKRIEI